MTGCSLTRTVYCLTNQKCLIRTKWDSLGTDRFNTMLGFVPLQMITYNPNTVISAMRDMWRHHPRYKGKKGTPLCKAESMRVVDSLALPSEAHARCWPVNIS